MSIREPNNLNNIDHRHPLWPKYWFVPFGSLPLIVTSCGSAIIHYSPDLDDCAMITQDQVHLTRIAAGPFY